MNFKNSDGKIFTFNEMVDEIIKWTKEYSDSKFTYVVASDSQVHKIRRKPIWYTTFVTVVWVHRDNKGGRVWIISEKIWEKMRIIDRLMKETSKSIEILQNFENSKLKDRVEEFCIHIDAGYDGKSKSVIDACMGWVTGMGYNAEIKPESVGAYTCADKFSK